MASLFIDTSYDITLGILDDEMNWIDFQRFSDQRSSSVLQKESHQILSVAGIKPKQLANVITVAGPGFYTGLRLSEGVADVFKFAGVQHLSFYSYDIPKILGVPSGFWMTKAYRGEYFFHQWDGLSFKNILIAENEFEKFLNPMTSEKAFIHSDSALDQFSKNILTTFEETHSLLKHNPAPLMLKIQEAGTAVPSYYFRAPEDEFRVSK